MQILASANHAPGGQSFQNSVALALQRMGMNVFEAVGHAVGAFEKTMKTINGSGPCGLQ